MKGVVSLLLKFTSYMQVYDDITYRHPQAADKSPCRTPSQYHCTEFPLVTGMYWWSHIATSESQTCFPSKAGKTGRKKKIQISREKNRRTCANLEDVSNVCWQMSRFSRQFWVGNIMISNWWFPVNQRKLGESRGYIVCMHLLDL